MTIREERPDDAGAIRAVHELAFAKPEEARMVELPRRSDGWVPELSLVAEDDGEVVGHVVLSYVPLDGGRVLLLGPIGVVPERQRQGIGSALVEEALGRAEARGEPVVLLEGNPAYYGRFGFVLASELGIEAPPEAPAQYFHVRRLSPACA